METAMARRLPELTLTIEENQRLVEWARRRTTAQALALRARIVLACAQGASTEEVAQRAGHTAYSAQMASALCGSAARWVA